MPRFRVCRKEVRRILIAVASCIGMLPSAIWPAQVASVSAAEFRANLVDVYGRYQGLLARRDACNVAFPQSKTVNDQAFVAWQGRHKKLLQDLDQKVSAMIRAYSKDEKDYSKNFGRFHGSVLQQRDEVQQTLLQQSRTELEQMCKDLPPFLQGSEADLEKEFADELKVIRAWKPPGSK